MEVNIYKNLSKQHSHRFGEIAVDMGFVTEEQLKEAMVEQVEDNLSSHPHRFIGYILFENGWITNEQFDSVLNILFKAPV
ncbi:MAG: hypothetical protein JYX80_11875 [Candidatus Scalindua sediminis]|nr:hypothetical protein [Candidatus Scalindua sediminis]